MASLDVNNFGEITGQRFQLGNLIDISPPGVYRYSSASSLEVDLKQAYRSERKVIFSGHFQVDYQFSIEGSAYWATFSCPRDVEAVATFDESYKSINIDFTYTLDYTSPNDRSSRITGESKTESVTLTKK